MENQISTMETMANDTGMPYSTDSINEYLLYLAENNLLIADDQNNFFYTNDKINGKLICYTKDDMISEINYCYDTEITNQVLLSDYYNSHNNIEKGAMLVESINDEYGFCADLDFYTNVKVTEFPVKAEAKIYCLALDLMFLPGLKEFEEIAKANPIIDKDSTSSENPIYMGSKMLIASGLIPESDVPIPSMAVISAEILDVNTRVNEFTKKEFFVLRCDGTIGEFELLCSPEFANENMKAGGVVNGYVLFRMEVMKIIN